VTLEEKIKKYLPEWLKSHPCSFNKWWLVQNAIGDIVGWKSWYYRWIPEVWASYKESEKLVEGKKKGKRCMNV
jgi:hypothetical protein